MNALNLCRRKFSPSRGAPLVLLLGWAPLFLSFNSLPAAEGPAKADPMPHVAAGRALPGQGIMLRREAPGQPWHFVAPGEKVFSGDLLLGAVNAGLETPDGAVRLNLTSDLDRVSPLPIRESAVVLHPDPKVDLDLTLDRGQVVLTNTKKEGPAHVRFRHRRSVFDLTLESPGDRVALEVYGRWRAGVPFTRKPGPKHVPIAHLIILTLKGRATLASGGKEFSLRAPPGPALLEWESVYGLDDSPQRLEKLPSWVEEGKEDSALARKKKAAGQRFLRLAKEKSIKEALDEFVTSDDPLERFLAVFAMGALDDLEGLARALRQTKYPDVWDNGVLALRHWIGRGPGQDQILYQGLIKKGKFTPVEAATVLELLHSFGENDLADPTTYQFLIDYLNHPRLAIRGLAYWHLSRLVPAGEAFGYSAFDPPEKRAAAVRKWRALIPKGKMPPRAGANGRKGA